MLLFSKFDLPFFLEKVSVRSYIGIVLFYKVVCQIKGMFW